MKILKNILLFLFSIFLMLVISEWVIATLAHRGFFKMDYPSYSLQDSYKKYWGDINPYFGVWHPPYSSYHHLKSCFDVTYKSNSYGARDKERSKESKLPRVLVVGDSFVEGYGLQEPARFSDILEKQTGIEHLNFATSGHFGPTQYYLLYKHLAKEFSHDMVIVMILPFNDFFDDDPEFGKKVHFNRYRPYWVGEYPNYQLEYYRDQIEWEKFEAWQQFKKILKNFSYTYNAVERLFEVKRLRAAMTEIPHFSGYYDYTDSQWNRMKFSLEKIVDEAKGKKVVFVSIPVPQDYEDPKKHNSSIAGPLKSFADSQGVLYVDLLDESLKRKMDWKAMFLACDNHWSEAGNRAAAEIVLEEIQKRYPNFYKP